MPVLPLSLMGKTTQLPRCQVPTPVLSPVVPGAMTSVPFVPRRTCTCGCFGAPSTGLQVIGPLTVAAPGFGKTATFSWIPIELSLASAARIDCRWFTCTITEPSLFSVMVYAAVTTFLMPPAAVPPAPVLPLVEVRPSPSAVPPAASASVLPAISPGRRARPGPGRVACSSAAPCSCARSRQRFSVNLAIVLVLLLQPGPRPGQALAECDTGDAEGLRRLLRGEPHQVDEVDRCPLDRGQPLEPPHERCTLTLGIDPPGELLDLVRVQRPVAAEPRDRVPPARRLLAMAGEHMRGDGEQPRPVRSPAGVEPCEAVHGPHERLRGEIGNRVRIAAPAREIAHEDVYVAQIHPLEFIKQRARRPPARPRPHRDRSLPHRPHRCSCLLMSLVAILAPGCDIVRPRRAAPHQARRLIPPPSRQPR